MSVLCPQCGAESPPGSRFCPGCGGGIVPVTGKAPARPRDVALGCLGIAFLVLVLVIASRSSTEEKDPNPGNDKISAMVTCEKFVRDRLKAPATTTFTGLRMMDRGEHHWSVTGYVDAQNGFGALIRNQFGCELTFEGLGKPWSASAVTITQR